MSVHKLRLGEFPSAAKDFGTGAIEAHHIIPTRHVACPDRLDGGVLSLLLNGLGSNVVRPPPGLNQPGRLWTPSPLQEYFDLRCDNQKN